MSVLLFLVVLFVSLLIVRIGAIAFQLTGIEWSIAKFQSLSCFTATGFTTKESELITSTRQRRNIAATLIVLGHAGFVTMIAALANSLRAQGILETSFSRPFFFMNLRTHPFVVPFVNVGVIIIGSYFIYKIFTNTRVAFKMTNALKKRLIKREMFKPVSFEELMLSAEGYGVSKITICSESPLLEKTLFDSGLRKYDITVLAITKKGLTTPNPAADSKIELNDELLCFGKLENIRKQMYKAV